MDPILALSQRTDIPTSVHINEVAHYLLPLPVKLPDNSQYQMKLVKHYKDAAETLKSRIVEAQNILKATEQSVKEKENSKPDEVDLQSTIKNEIQLYKVLYYKIKSIRLKIAGLTLQESKKQLSSLKQLRILANWLATNPCPIIINIERAAPKPTAKLFSSNQRLYKKYRAMKIALKEQISLINHSPYSYRMKNENRRFIRSAVDTAMASRKANTSYFESLSIEESLFQFFDSHNSPISKAGLLPIQVSDSEEAISWISRAAQAVAQLDDIPIPERMDVINIFIVRYFFDRTYPQFQPTVKADDPKFSKTRQRVVAMTPEEAHIPKKYIPPQCADKPVSQLFEATSITKAPAMWMTMMQFKCCPLDVAYYIFKVHESLSIMATLQATENKENYLGELSLDYDFLIELQQELKSPQVNTTEERKKQNEEIGEIVSDAIEYLNQRGSFWSQQGTHAKAENDDDDLDQTPKTTRTRTTRSPSASKKSARAQSSRGPPHYEMSKLQQYESRYPSK